MHAGEENFERKTDKESGKENTKACLRERITPVAMRILHFLSRNATRAHKQNKTVSLLTFKVIGETSRNLHDVGKCV